MELLTFILVFILVIGFVLYSDQIRTERINTEIEGLRNNTMEMTPQEFLEMRRTTFGLPGERSYALSKNFAGVYILHNETKDLYYVGQGQQVLNRVYAHFSGREMVMYMPIISMVILLL